MTPSTLKDLSLQTSYDQAIDIGALFAPVERLLARPLEAIDQLRQVVEAITGQNAHLQCLPRAYWSRSAHYGEMRQFPVVYSHRVYGTLLVNPDLDDSAQPALPDEQVRQLASACGALLYLLEQAVLIQALCRHLSPEFVEPLTARQREVLGLLVQGFTNEEIAQALCITPETLKKHRLEIYRRLGVHHAKDVFLMAYQAQVLSYLPPSPGRVLSPLFPRSARRGA